MKQQNNQIADIPAIDQDIYEIRFEGKNDARATLFDQLEQQGVF